MVIGEIVGIFLLREKEFVMRYTPINGKVVT
jgi:hypothetical protein